MSLRFRMFRIVVGSTYPLKQTKNKPHIPNRAAYSTTTIPDYTATDLRRQVSCIGFHLWCTDRFCLQSLVIWRLRLIFNRLLPGLYIDQFLQLLCRDTTMICCWLWLIFFEKKLGLYQVNFAELVEEVFVMTNAAVDRSHAPLVKPGLNIYIKGLEVPEVPFPWWRCIRMHTSNNPSAQDCTRVPAIDIHWCLPLSMDACDLEPKSVRFIHGYWEVSDRVIVPERFHSQLEVFCLYSPRWVMGMTVWLLRTKHIIQNCSKHCQTGLKNLEQALFRFSLCVRCRCGAQEQAERHDTDSTCATGLQLRVKRIWKKSTARKLVVSVLVLGDTALPRNSHHRDYYVWGHLLLLQGGGASQKIYT